MKMTVTAASTPRKTEAWVPRLKVKIPRQSKSLDESRPLTATLERPLVLDIALLKKLDMTSFTKKGLMTISKLCGVSLVKKSEIKRGNKISRTRKHLRKQSSNDLRIKKSSKLKVPDVSTELSSDESFASGKTRTKNEETLKSNDKVPKSENRKMKLKEDDSWIDDDSSNSDVVTKKRINRKTVKENDRRIPGIKLNNREMIKRSATIDDVFSGPIKNLVPEPCRTCGRPEQPERFHSHPKTPIKVPEVQKAAKPIKTEISKPIPAKYKSAGKGDKNAASDKGIAKEKPNKAEESSEKVEKAPVRPVSGKPRLITCYLCAREFGTASFPLHEVRCIEKWERENNQLPPDLRRKLPEKPNGPMTTEEWNNFAWKVAQESLVPCEKCGRTFNPDRIRVHVKVCKEQTQKNWPGFKAESVGNLEDRPSTASRPPTIICYICGREFGTKSIGIHEPQCLKKWHNENDKLPEKLRRPEPVRPDDGLKYVTGCYICGEEMAPRQRIKHEIECIKKWREDNLRLPLEKRKEEPKRPDFRFTASGDADCEGTFQSIWTNHMESLVPCPKCGRRFFPDRIERHISCCNNQPINIKHKSPRK